MGHLGSERLGWWGWDGWDVMWCDVMCGWNGCDVDVDVNSKEKINPFLPDLGRDGLRMREREREGATSLVSDMKSVTCKER